MRRSKELQIGKAGEYMTCSDLIMKGLIAYPSEQGLPYDVLIDTGKKLLKCQVKTTTEPRCIPQRTKKSYAYIFNIKRHGKNNKLIYSKFEVDVFALVSLDTRQVGYLINKDMPLTLNLRVDSMRGQYYDEQGEKTYNIIKSLSDGKTTQTEIANKTGLHVSRVNQILKKDYKPHKSNALYMSDIQREEEWFYNV